MQNARGVRLLPLLVLAAAACGPDELVTHQVWTPGDGLVGVDSDGEGGLWLAYNQDYVDDYYGTDTARIVHVDRDFHVLREWLFHDSYTSINGIAYSGGAVFVNLGGGFSDDNRIRRLDPTTGQETDSFAMDVGIVDLAVRDDELLLSNMWNQVVGISRINGGEQWRAELALPEGGTLRGIAVDDAGTWVLCQETDEIYLVDDSGQIQMTYAIPGYQGTYDDHTDHLTFDGERFVVTHDNLVVWLERP